tara:strand:- start:43 stop:369 length:327 start_codon:yes stop_codon:yes gene_type:complete
MRLYHNPRCSKSRQAVEILNSRGIKYEEYRYLEKGIHQDDLELFSSLPNIIRTVEKEYKFINYNLSKKENIAKALSQFPRLLQRPILVSKGKAVIGRPPEEIIGLFED